MWRIPVPLVVTRVKKKRGGTGEGRTGGQGKVPLLSHWAKAGPSLNTDQTDYFLTNILDLPPSSAFSFSILIRWSSSDTHSFREGGSEDFQCLGMTVRAAVRTFLKSPFFKEEIEPGSIIEVPMRETWECQSQLENYGAEILIPKREGALGNPTICATWYPEQYLNTSSNSTWRGTSYVRGWVPACQNCIILFLSKTGYWQFMREYDRFLPFICRKLRT